MHRRHDPYEFVETTRLVSDSLALCQELPPSLDAVIGIARSGMIPASVIATHLHLPLYSTTSNPDEFAIRCGAGHRLSPPSARPAVFLLVDDTTATGNQLRRAQALVQAQFPDAKILTAVIYATPATIPMVDYVAVEAPLPHYLEYQLPNGGFLCKAIFDMDGVLCCDPIPAEDDDGPRYTAFLANTRPLMLPRHAPVQAIVTGRLEKYRPQTEAWLKKWGIKCDRVIMGPWASQRERQGNIGTWKGLVYKSLPHALFVESHPLQALQIAKIAGKPVLCPALKRVVWGDEQICQSPTTNPVAASA